MSLTITHRFFSIHLAHSSISTKRITFRNSHKTEISILELIQLCVYGYHLGQNGGSLWLEDL